jgi:hypothetical protein
MLSRALLFAFALATLPAVAGAQTAGPSTARPDRIATLAGTAFSDAIAPGAASLDDATPPQAPPRRKDPLWNGVVIGAGLGAVVGALVGASAFECSECTGFNVPLTFGVIGAGAGAGIGAGIDAVLHQRSPLPHLPGRARRVNVSPVVGKDLKAFVAWIRF